MSTCTKRYAILGFALFGSVVAGCGSGEAPSDTASTSSASPKVQIQVATPANGATIRTSAVALRGTVSPPQATVTVLGKAATVKAGVFQANVPLQPGNNAVDIEATATGATPATMTVNVTRGKTLAQLAVIRKRAAARAAKHAAARKKRAQARREREAAAASARRAAANAPVGVPSIVGERLDVGELDLRGAHLRYSEVGGGTFGIVVKSNWVICETRPSAGTSVPKKTRVTVIVGRSC